jgi:hypothetical protein
MSAIDDDLNDDLSDLIGVPTKPRPVTPPAHYQPRTFTEPCAKCGGSGKFIGRNGRVVGDCFCCKGTGKHEFKTSQGERAKGRARTAVKAANRAAEKTAWRETHKAELDWLHGVANREETRMGMPPFKYWEFPVELRNSLSEHGTLTDGQIGAIRKCMAKEVERTEARKAAAPVADSAGIDSLKAAFDKAIAYTADKGLKLSPRVTIGGMTISPAKATSANPGALYVKAGQTYLGKITGGRFFASPDCSAEQQAQVLAFVANPAWAAKVYGQTTGTCCVCNATLTSQWKLRGIGPVCAEKFGWGA